MKDYKQQGKPKGRLQPINQISIRVQEQDDLDILQDIDPGMLMMNIEDEKVRYELDPGLNEFNFSDLDYDNIKINGDEENDNNNGQGTSQQQLNSPSPDLMHKRRSIHDSEEKEHLLSNKVYSQSFLKYKIQGDSILYPGVIEKLMTEVQRFKLNSIFTSKQKKLAIERNPIYKELHEESNGIIKDDVQKIIKVPVNYTSLTLLRRLARIFYHVCLVVVVMLIFMIGASLTVRFGTTILPGIENNQYKLNIRLRNSQLIIQEGVDSDIIFSYNALLSLAAYFDQSIVQTQVDIGTVNDQFFVKLVGGYLIPKFCVATLSIPANLMWQDVYISCDNGTTCYVISDVPGFTVNNTLNIQAQGTSTMYANFREIITDRFNYSSPVGALVIGNFQVSTYFYAYLQTGPVMIQSENDFNLRFNASFQALCASSPLMGPNITSQCYIYGNNASSVFNQSTGCTGQVRLCISANDKCSKPLALTPIEKALLQYQNAYNTALQIKAQKVLNALGIFDVKLASSNFQVQHLPDDSGIQQVEVICYNGGLYTNALSKKLGVPHGNDLFRSGIYNLPLNFSPDYKNQILNLFQQIPAGADFTFSLTIGGPKFLQANAMTFWTFFTNPAFAQLRPWWLSTLSGTVLTAETINLSGFLAPGICPFQSQPTIEVMNEMQIMIQNLFQKPTALTAFIQQVGMPLVPLTNQEQLQLNETHSTVRLNPNDLYHFVNGDTEEWYSISYSKHHYVLNAISISNNTLIFIAVALSFLASFLMSCIGIAIVKATFVVLNDNLLAQSEHHGNYCQSTSIKKKKNGASTSQDLLVDLNVANIFERTKWTVFLREAPKFSSCVDYYAYTTSSKFLVDSSVEFYKMMFRHATAQEELQFMQGELDEDKYLSIGEKELKNLYEKFCYLNHYTPLSLSDPMQVQKLSNFGFQIVDDLEKAQVFSKLSPKKEVEEPLSSQLNTKSTLELFIKINYDITTINTDTEWVEDFEEKYQVFCQEYRLPGEIVRIDNIASRFNLDVLLRPRKKVVKNRQSSQDDNQAVGVDNQGGQMKSMFKGVLSIVIKDKASIYLIDRELIQYHFKILSDPQSFADQELEDFLPLSIKNTVLFISGLNKLKTITPAQILKEKPLGVMLQTIYYRFWFILDLIIVGMHMSIVFVLVIPSFAIVLITKISYAPFSLYHESDILTGPDLLYSPWVIFAKFFSYELYIQILIIIIFYFLGVLFCQELFMYYHSKFPEDASFRGNYKDLKASGSFTRGINIFQWIFIFFLLFVIFFYVSLVAIWLLLGAIINPNNFLVYTSSVSTLITILTSKLTEMEKLYKKGMQEVQNIVDQFYQNTVKGIAGAIVAGAKSAPVGDGQGDQGGALGNLGSEMKGMLSGLDGLKDPAMIKQKLEEQKMILQEQFRTILVQKLRELTLPEEFCILLPTILMENEDQIATVMSDFISKISGGSLNPKLFKWLIQTFSQIKSLAGGKNDPKKLQKMQKDLEQSHKQLMEACIETFMTITIKRKIDEEEIQEFQKIIIETVSLLLSIQEGKHENLLSMVKTIIQISSKKKEYSQKTLFIFMKVIDLIDLYFKKQIDQNKVLQFIMEFLVMFNVPTNIGMLLTIIFSKGSNFYQYRQLIITNQQQMSFFIQSILTNLTKHIERQGLAKSEDLKFFIPFIEKAYVLILKMSVYRATPENVKDVVQLLISFLVQKHNEFNPKIEILPDSSNSYVDEIDEVDIKQVENQSLKKILEGRFSSQSVEILENILSFSASIIPLLLVLNKDWYREIESITQRTGTNQDFIQDFSCLGTRTVWNIISSFNKKRGADLNAKNMYSSRSAYLDQDNDILKCIAKELRMEPKVLIGMFELMHCEVDYDSNCEYFSEYLFYVSDQVLKVKEEVKRQGLLILIKILCSTNYQDFLQALDLYSNICTLYRIQCDSDEIKVILKQVTDSQPELAEIFQMPKGFAGGFPKNQTHKQHLSGQKNFLNDFKMNFLDNSSDQQNKQKIKRICNFYSIVTGVKEGQQNKEKILLSLQKLFSEGNSEIILVLVEFLSVKATIHPISQVVLLERAQALALKLNFQRESLIHLANLILFESVEMVSGSVTFFCQNDLSNFEVKMNQLSKHVPEAKNKQVFQDKLAMLARILIDIDNVFDPSNIQPMMVPFLPDWLEGNQDIILNTVLETSFKVGKAAQVKLTNNVLDLFKPVFSNQASQYELFKSAMTAFISRQDNLLGAFFQQAQTKLKLQNDDLINVIKALNNDDMISLLTLIFRNMFKTSTDNSGNLNQPLLIMANTLAALMVRNHKEIAYLVQKENQNLYELYENQSKDEEVVLDLEGQPIKKFDWNEEFIWIVGHLKYFFTTDQQAFSEFTIVLFKKVFKFDSIDQNQIVTIMSLYSDKPNLDQVASMLKIPSAQIELANLLCRLTISKQDKKLSMIGELNKSLGLTSILNKLGIDVAEFSYLLKFVTKNLSANDWREFLITINLGEGANINIVKSLLGLTVSFDNMIADDYEKLKKNYNSYYEMRKYMYQNLGLDAEIMELVFNIKRGRINNLKFMNEDSQLLSNQTKLFGSSSKIVEIVSALIAIVIQDQTNLYANLSIQQILKLLSKLDETYYTRNNFESALYLLYIHLGLNPLVVLAILGNKNAIHLVKTYLGNQLGVKLQWDHIEKLLEALSNYKAISHVERLKIMECEFFSLIAASLTTVGLDDDFVDMNQLKNEKVNIQSLKEKMIELLLQSFKDPLLSNIVNSKDIDLSQLFKINPKKNKNLWAVNFPVIAFMLISQISIMRTTIQNKDKVGVDQQTYKNMKLQRSIQFILSFDFILSLVERMLYVNYHDDLKGFNKAAILQLMALVFQNKQISKGKNMSDVLPLLIFELVCYPSLYNQNLTQRYYKPANDNINDQQIPGNPFLLDFSKDLEILRKAKPFKEDPEVRRKAVCKALYLNREIYQRCFMQLITETPNLDRKAASMLLGVNQKIEASIIYEGAKFDQELNLSNILSIFGYCGVYSDQDSPGLKSPRQSLIPGKIQEQKLFTGASQKIIDRFSFQNLSNDLTQYVKCSPLFHDCILKAESSNLTKKLHQALLLMTKTKNLLQSENNPLSEGQVQNMQEQQKIYQYLTNIPQDLKNIFSLRSDKLKQLVQQLSIKNLTIFIGNENTIDLVLGFAEFLQPLQQEIFGQKNDKHESRASKLIQTLRTQVRFKSNVFGLMKLLTFIIDPINVNEESLEWIIQNCFDGKKEVVYGIMLPLLRILQEKHKLNIKLSQDIQYLTYGDRIDLKTIADYPQQYSTLQNKYKQMSANTELVGEALEDLIAKIQSIPQKQRSFLKIIIRCYSGEIEAWVSLLEYLNIYQAFPGQEQTQIVQSLFMQMLLGFKGSGKREALTQFKLRQLTILEMISQSNFNQEFFKMFEKIIPIGDTSGFKEFIKILVLIVERKYTDLIDKVPDLLSFVKVESQDLCSLVKLTISFIAFNQLNESKLSFYLQGMLRRQNNGQIKLQNILSGFTKEFSSDFIDFKAFQPLIMMLMQYAYTHDLSVIYQQLMKFEKEFKDKQNGDVVQFVKYFLSINLWFKLKYLPSMHESNHLVDAFPAIAFPIYLIVEKILGEEQLNKILPGYSKIFEKLVFFGSLTELVSNKKIKLDYNSKNQIRLDNNFKLEHVHQDVYVHLVLVLKEIARNIDLKSTSNLISPSVIGFLMKNFGEFQDEYEKIKKSMKKYQFEALYGQILPLFKSFEDTWFQIIDSQPIIKKLMDIGEAFLSGMIGQLGFAQISNTELITRMPPIIEDFIESELNCSADDMNQIKNLIHLIFNLYGLISSPQMNYTFYQQSIHFLENLLGRKDLTNILQLVGEFTKDSFIDQKKISQLCESLLSTLADPNCLIHTNIEDPNVKEKLEEDNLKNIGEDNQDKGKDNQDKEKDNLDKGKDNLDKIIQFAFFQTKIMQIIRDITTNGISETMIVDIVIQLLTILMDENEAQKMVLIINTIIALFHKKFEEIDENFFLLMKVTPERAKVVISLLKNFNQSLKHPMQMLESKSSELLNKDSNPSSRRLDLVMGKVKSDETLSKQDLFSLIDISGDGQIDIPEYQRFLKRTGVNLTDHKLLEIFTKIKGSQTPGEDVTLNQAEFEKAMEYIQNQSIQLTMESLGITKEILTFALIYLVFLVLILFAFILVGIQAFSVPSTFGSIVNSAFPMAGGGGVTSAKKQDLEELFDPKKLKEITQKCMKIVQSMKI